MISESTIQALRSRISIADVISNYIKLKKSGSNLTGLCPFHNERSPSFMVSPAKEIYKCFGCGKSGDAISFIMEHEHKTYPETIEHLCNQYNIAIEHQEPTPQQQQQKDKKQEMYQLMAWAADQYEKQLHQLPADDHIIQYLADRGYTKERIQYWGIGIAPAEWDFIKTPIINKNQFEIGIEAGLIHRSGEKNYDFFRNRIIIPIHDQHGRIIAFGARQCPPLEGVAQSAGGGGPKYLNSPESLIYQKRQTWYGLWQAQKTISQQKLAYIVEGYMDVHAMQDAGLTNTIAPCGTEIHDDQLQILRRYTTSVCLVGDADQSGIKATLRHIDRFLQHDFSVSIIPLPSASGEKMDPDQYIRSLTNQTIAA